MVVVQCDPDLTEIVLALRAPSRFARRLHRRQQKRYQYPDDGNHD